MQIHETRRTRAVNNDVVGSLVGLNGYLGYHKARDRSVLDPQITFSSGEHDESRSASLHGVLGETYLPTVNRDIDGAPNLKSAGGKGLLLEPKHCTIP
jgi:hypothetical protein